MKRYYFLDDLRGLNLISMVCFHGVWDAVYIFGMDWKWFYSPIAYIWQQSICWTFILLSGFCWNFGRRKLRRGLVVLFSGFAVSLVTELIMPEQRIRFGVLTLLGICMLAMIPLSRIVSKLSAFTGLGASMILFVVTRNINDGYLGFEKINLLRLPEKLYHMGDAATLIGFSDTSFYSADYFSIMPWFFLFLSGYFLNRITEEKNWMDLMLRWKPAGKILGYMGRRSLVIYLLHQPVIYLGLSILYS